VITVVTWRVAVWRRRVCWGAISSGAKKIIPPIRYITPDTPSFFKSGSIRFRTFPRRERARSRASQPSRHQPRPPPSSNCGRGASASDVRVLSKRTMINFPRLYGRVQMSGCVLYFFLFFHQPYMRICTRIRILFNGTCNFAITHK